MAIFSSPHYQKGHFNIPKTTHFVTNISIITLPKIVGESHGMLINVQVILKKAGPTRTQRVWMSLVTRRAAGIARSPVLRQETLGLATIPLWRKGSSRGSKVPHGTFPYIGFVDLIDSPVVSSLKVKV